MEKNDRKQEIKGTIMALSGGIFWGFCGVAGQYLFMYAGVTSRWLVPIRLTMAGLLILIYYLVRDFATGFSGENVLFSVWKDKRDVFELLVYAIAGVMMVQYSYFQTIEWSNAGTATVIQYLSPTMIVVWTCLRKQRKPFRFEIVAVVLTLLGIYLLVTGGNPGNLILSPKAFFMGILSAVTLVIYTIWPGRLQSRYPTTLIVGWGMLIGGIIITILFKPWTLPVAVTPVVIGGMSFIILVGTIMAFSLYLLAVKEIGSVKTSLYACVEPVASVILTAFWLKNSFSVTDLAGMILIVVTVVMLSVKKAEVKHLPPSPT